MTDGFVNIWVEQRGKRFFTVMETGDGRRTISQPFRTEHAANKRAEKALETLLRMHPEAEISDGQQVRDETPAAEPAKSASESPCGARAGHEVRNA